LSDKTDQKKRTIQALNQTVFADGSQFSNLRLKHGKSEQKARDIAHAGVGSVCPMCKKTHLIHVQKTVLETAGYRCSTCNFSNVRYYGKKIPPWIDQFLRQDLSRLRFFSRTDIGSLGGCSASNVEIYFRKNNVSGELGRRLHRGKIIRVVLFEKEYLVDRLTQISTMNQLAMADRVRRRGAPLAKRMRQKLKDFKDYMRPKKQKPYASASIE